MEMIENCQNKADCSGVCRFQIRVYDKNMGDPVRPLMADESQKPPLERNRSAVGKSQSLGDPASALLCSCFASAVPCPDRPSCPRDQSPY
jgi:hypothetical protein